MKKIAPIHIDDNMSDEKRSAMTRDLFLDLRRNGVVGGIFAHGGTVSNKLIMIPEGIHLRPVVPVGTDLELLPIGRQPEPRVGHVQLKQDDLHAISTQAVNMLSSPSGRHMLYYQMDLFEKNMQSHQYNPGDLIYDTSLKFSENMPDKFQSDGSIYMVYHTIGIVRDGYTIPTARERVIQPYLPRLPDETDDDYMARNVLPIIRDELQTGHDETIITKDLIWEKEMTLGKVLKLLKEKHKEGRYFIYACRGVDDINELYANLRCIGIDVPTVVSVDQKESDGRQAVQSTSHPMDRSNNSDAKELLPPPLIRSISNTKEFKNFKMILDEIEEYYHTLTIKSKSIEECKQLIDRIRNEYEVSKEVFCKLYEYHIFINKTDKLLKDLYKNIHHIIGVRQADFLIPTDQVIRWKTFAGVLVIIRFIIDSRYNISSNIQNFLDNLEDILIGKNIKNMLSRSRIFDTPTLGLTSVQYDKLMARQCDNFVEEVFTKYAELTKKMQPHNDSNATAIFNMLNNNMDQLGGSGYRKYHYNKCKYLLL